MLPGEGRTPGGLPLVMSLEMRQIYPEMFKLEEAEASKAEGTEKTRRDCFLLFDPLRLLKGRADGYRIGKDNVYSTFSLRRFSWRSVNVVSDLGGTVAVVFL